MNGLGEKTGAQYIVKERKGGLRNRITRLTFHKHDHDDDDCRMDR